MMNFSSTSPSSHKRVECFKSIIIIIIIIILVFIYERTFLNYNISKSVFLKKMFKNL